MPLDLVAVKGRDGGDRGAPGRRRRTRRGWRRWPRPLAGLRAAYAAGDWGDGAEATAEALAQVDCPACDTAQLVRAYASGSRRCAGPPPGPGWTGIYRADSKALSATGTDPRPEIPARPPGKATRTGRSISSAVKLNWVASQDALFQRASVGVPASSPPAEKFRHRILAHRVVGRCRYRALPPVVETGCRSGGVVRADAGSCRAGRCRICGVPSIRARAEARKSGVDPADIAHRRRTAPRRAGWCIAAPRPAASGNSRFAGQEHGIGGAALEHTRVDEPRTPIVAEGVVIVALAVFGRLAADKAQRRRWSGGCRHRRRRHWGHKRRSHPARCGWTAPATGWFWSRNSNCARPAGAGLHGFARHHGIADRQGSGFRRPAACRAGSVERGDGAISCAVAGRARLRAAEAERIMLPHHQNSIPTMIPTRVS